MTRAEFVAILDSFMGAVARDPVEGGAQEKVAVVAAWDAQSQAFAEAREERIEALEKAAGRERQLSEAWRSLAAAEARAAALEAALRYLSNDPDDPDECWCNGEPHDDWCVKAQAALRSASPAPGAREAGGTDGE